MKKIIYLFALIALSVGLTCAQAASPTYDDNPPPSYIWGEGEINSQTSGTPNKNREERIIDTLKIENIKVTELVNGIGTDTSEIKTEVASISSNLANSLKSSIDALGDMNVNVEAISVDTGNIESYLKKEDKSIAELLNGIGTDTTLIKNYLTNNIGTAVGGQTVLYVMNQILGELGNLYTIGTSIDGSSSSVDSNLDYQIARNVVENMYTQRKSITANTATALGHLNNAPLIKNNRVFIEIRAVDPSKEFFIGFDSNVTNLTGRPVIGRILLNIDYSQNIYIYHTDSSSLAIQQTEGWH